tara:strand:+ start:2026 stop:2493 length:468 start_codon:yes stop_codon:yes gene_type:complete
VGQKLKQQMLDSQGYLKLKADDATDLKVFAAYLQDSLTISKDIKFLEKNKTFICIFNRFMWEDAEKGIFRDNKRIRSAFKINDVRSVKSKNINVKEKKILEFLTINIEESENKNIDINLLFSGNMTISVNVETIDATLEDFSDSWKTKIKPVHKI